MLGGGADASVWPSESLPTRKGTRLTDSPEFERVYRQGRAFRGRLFSVHEFPNEFGNPRLGLSVSKRVGNSVTRNAVRRKLREVFRAAAPSVSGASDFVISARPLAANADFTELSDEFTRALRKFGRLDEGRGDVARSGA